jgi:hypothetical protein
MAKRRKPSRPHINEKPTPRNKPIDNNSAKDQGGTVRDWPNELGAIVQSPLLGEGYYSDPSGLPGGGLSVSEWRKKKNKKRKQNARRANKIMATYILANMYLKIAKEIESNQIGVE